MIRTIEELSINAWPALRTMFYDGWIMRFSNGYTRRANSINPLYPSEIRLDEKLRACEDLYRRKGQDVVFKITPAMTPPDLDAQLAANGYQHDAPTSVQLLDLAKFSPQDHSVTISEDSLPQEWLDGYCRLAAVSETRRDTLRGMLANIVPNHAYFSIKAQDEIIACGLGVLQDGFVGLFDIITSPQCRRQGQGQRIVESILAWGKQNQAVTSYLQVMLNNPPALRLYAKIGFVEEYQYWYRVKP